MESVWLIVALGCAVYGSMLMNDGESDDAGFFFIMAIIAAMSFGFKRYMRQRMEKNRD